MSFPALEYQTVKIILYYRRNLLETPDKEHILITADGSSSLVSRALNQMYHSSGGALTESEHIFMGLGLKPLLDTARQPTNFPVPLRIFEMGFGTGLNALLAWKLADETGFPVHYTGLEAYPVTDIEHASLNFGEITGKPEFPLLHQSPWGEDVPLSSFFSFRKEKQFLEHFHTQQRFDLIFFDAFSPNAQPELWTEEIFSRIASFTEPGGILVTYSSKGIVRRALQQAGFTVEKHPGPGRKREVVRAIKN